MSVEGNIAVVRSLYAAFNTGDGDALERLIPAIQTEPTVPCHMFVAPAGELV